MEDEKGFDPVNRPRHYQHVSGVETICINEHMGFCLGNALKYVIRHELKGNPIEDLSKALWYCRREWDNREKWRKESSEEMLNALYVKDIDPPEGQEFVDRFLEAEPSQFVRTVVGCLWHAHRWWDMVAGVKTACEELEQEIARRKAEGG